MPTLTSGASAACPPPEPAGTDVTLGHCTLLGEPAGLSVSVLRPGRQINASALRRQAVVVLVDPLGAGPSRFPVPRGRIEPRRAEGPDVGGTWVGAGGSPARARRGRTTRRRHARCRPRPSPGRARRAPARTMKRPSGGAERREPAEDRADPGFGDRRREGGEVARESGQDIPVGRPHGQDPPEGHRTPGRGSARPVPTLRRGFPAPSASCVQPAGQGCAEPARVGGASPRRPW